MINECVTNEPQRTSAGRLFVKRRSIELSSQMLLKFLSRSELENFVFKMSS